MPHQRGDSYPDFSLGYQDDPSAIALPDFQVFTPSSGPSLFASSDAMSNHVKHGLYPHDSQLSSHFSTSELNMNSWYKEGEVDQGQINGFPTDYAPLSQWEPPPLNNDSFSISVDSGFHSGNFGWRSPPSTSYDSLKVYSTSASENSISPVMSTGYESQTAESSPYVESLVFLLIQSIVVATGECIR